MYRPRYGMRRYGKPRFGMKRYRSRYGKRIPRPISYRKPAGYRRGYVSRLARDVKQLKKASTADIQVVHRYSNIEVKGYQTVKVPGKEDTIIPGTKRRWLLEGFKLQQFNAMGGASGVSNKAYLSNYANIKEVIINEGKSDETLVDEEFASQVFFIRKTPEDPDDDLAKHYGLWGVERFRALNLKIEMLIRLRIDTSLVMRIMVVQFKNAQESSVSQREANSILQYARRGSKKMNEEEFQNTMMSGYARNPQVEFKVLYDKKLIKNALIEKQKADTACAERTIRLTIRPRVRGMQIEKGGTENEIRIFWVADTPGEEHATAKISWLTTERFYK